jgi:hypothetical protein
MDMHLFNPKTIERHLPSATPIPPVHMEHLSEWADTISSGRILGIKETALHADFKSKIVEGVLGYVSAVKRRSHRHFRAGNPTRVGRSSPW